MKDHIHFGKQFQIYLLSNYFNMFQRYKPSHKLIIFSNKVIGIRGGSIFCCFRSHPPQIYILDETQILKE